MRSRTRSSRGVAALAALTVLSVGCGDERSASREPTGTPSTTSSTTAVADGPPPFPAPSPASVGLELPTDCPLPWLPVYAQVVQNPPSGNPLTEVPPGEGAPIDPLTRRSSPPDTDGDGAPDQVLEGVDDGSSFGLRRSDGDLVLAVDGGTVGAPGGASWVGDLDGDDRDDLLVFVADGTSDRYPDVVVSGAVGAGRHDPREVGVILPPTPILPVGDVDADGADDLVIANSDDELVVVSGRDVLATPGGSLERDTTPISSLPDDVKGVVFLGEERPVPVVPAAADDGSGATELTLLTEPPIVLRTDRVPGIPDGEVSAFLTDGQRYVRLTNIPGRAVDHVEFIWNLDDPCAGPTPTG